MEEFQSSGEKYKAFKDICKNASVEDWAALKNSEKKTYVCMKRKYDTMIRLELAQKQLCPSGNARASGQQIQKSSAEI
ncbi:putative protein SSX10 [Molossus molossus]|uniref:putative protein SSX10 n=1 Tax=Molossus molossus TaxID=27622 RepID=UPI001747CC1C|nr:putative protein SSX10 [Molossus molossus]